MSKKTSMTSRSSLSPSHILPARPSVKTANVKAKSASGKLEGKNKKLLERVDDIEDIYDKILYLLQDDFKERKDRQKGITKELKDFKTKIANIKYGFLSDNQYLQRVDRKAKKRTFKISSAKRPTTAR